MFVSHQSNVHGVVKLPCTQVRAFECFHDALQKNTSGRTVREF